MIHLRYTCPQCASTDAAVPLRAGDGLLVKCAGCGRSHGRLAAVRAEIIASFRNEAAEKAKRVYGSAPRQGKVKPKL